MTKDHKKLAIIAALIVGGICLNHLIPRSGRATSPNTSPNDLHQTNADGSAAVSTNVSSQKIP
jgi:hypothetical protein